MFVEEGDPTDLETHAARVGLEAVLFEVPPSAVAGFARATPPQEEITRETPKSI